MKLPHNTCLGAVLGKSATCHGKSPTWIVLWGSFGVSNHRDMSKWFEKFPWQVGNQPVCVRETGKSVTSATRHGKVGEVADKSTGTSQVYRGLVAYVTGKLAWWNLGLMQSARHSVQCNITTHQWQRTYADHLSLRIMSINMPSLWRW